MIWKEAIMAEWRYYPRYFPGGNDEYQTKSHLGSTVSRSRFEPSPYRLQVTNFTFIQPVRQSSIVFSAESVHLYMRVADRCMLNHGLLYMHNNVVLTGM
jgi:hypothetical protein